MAFTNTPPKPDPTLRDRLIAEWPEILRWLIEGCLEWQAHGLNPPKSVQATTKAYFETQDVSGDGSRNAASSTSSCKPGQVLR